MVISFLLSTVTALAYRTIIKRSKKMKMSNPKGGAFIDNGIKPDSIYELVDPSLQVVVKQMLYLPPEAGPIVISAPVLVLSYISSRDI